MRVIGSLLRMLSPALRSQPLRLQSQMDIHPDSLWHNPAFVEQSGGFLPRSARAGRHIADGPAWDSVRRDMLVLLMRDIVERGIAGSVAELGVFRGETARIIHHYLPERRLHLFDTFEGFDKRDTALEAARMDSEVTPGLFSETSIEAVRRHIQPRTGNVVFHPGRFPDSCSAEVLQERFALVHLDADIYAPTMAGLEVLFPLLAEGGYAVVHDYNAWQGARAATDEFCAARRLVPVPMPDKNGSAVILKPLA